MKFLYVAAALAVSGLAALPSRAAPAPAPFDLSALPVYEPGLKVTGTIRDFGFGMDGLLKLWEQDFQALQPGIRFDDRLPTSDAAIPALVTGVTDLAPDGGEPIITESLSFFETWGHPPTAITVASGAYDVEGHSNGPVVYVSKDNPLTHLTLRQLDGIFGAARTGGLDGFKWSLAGARGPEADIRTWGQLGLSGDWADKPIQTYGHAPSGTTRFFQWKVLHNSDKWNPNYREYVETGSKMIADEDKATQKLGVRHMLGEELARNPYGIAWTVVPQARGIAGIRAIRIAPRAGQPAVAPNKDTFADRSYPLVRSIYIYLNRKPGTPVDARLREFLRFILSRQGQAIVASNGSYLPLPAATVIEQLRKLD